MSKPIPKQPLKVSKSKKTLPVEIDWGQGMKDRLRYISPGEEALIQRHRSTDAERYYGGIRAYPDPSDTAVGTGNWTGAPGSGTTSPGASSGGGSDSGAGASTSAASSSSPASAASTTPGGSDAGAVASSAAADPGHSVGYGAGAESVMRSTEDDYRNGVNSLNGESINSGNIVSQSAAAHPQATYSYNSPAPPPVQSRAPTYSSSTAASIYGPDYVTDDMLPDYGSMYPSAPKTVSAVDSLKGMLTNGGTYIGPAKVAPPAPDAVASAPDTYSYQGALDRLANSTSVIGTTNPVGFQKYADRVPAAPTGVDSLTLEDDNFTDTKRGINTIASSEGLPEVDVAATITRPVPQTPSASMSQGKFDWTDAYKTNPMTYTPPSSVAQQQGIGAIDPERETESFKSTAEKVLEVEDVPPETAVSQPLEINIDGTGVPVAEGPPPGSQPTKYRGITGFAQNSVKPKDPSLMDNKLISMGDKTVDMSTLPAEVQQNLRQNPDFDAFTANPPVYKPPGGAAVPQVQGPPDPRGGITELQDDADTGAGEVIDGMTGDEATKAAVKAGIPRNVATADWFRNDPSQLGVLGEPVAPDTITPTDMVKLHQRSMAQKYDDIDPYLTPEENTRKKVSNAMENFILNRTGPAGVIAKNVRNAMGVEKTEDFLGRPSYEQDALYKYGAEADARYGRSPFQGGREGGGDITVLWAQGIGIPNVNDPSYSTYMYWLNSQGSSSDWGWS